MTPVKDKQPGMPVENHSTAAWACIGKMKKVSNVTVPSEHCVYRAKEHVDNNEK